MDATDVSQDLEKVLFTSAEIQARIDEVAQQIDEDYAGRDILLVTGYDEANARMRISVPPGIEPRRVSVDAIEHWMIYQAHPDVGVLNGAVMVMSDLQRAMRSHVEMDWMAVSSYGAGTQSSGVVRILKDLNVSIQGRNVLVVEDIIDSGHTLNYLLRLLQERQPASLRVVTLLDKPDRRAVPIDVDWVGFSIPNEFVVGYGLDYNELYRNLPYIGVLKPSVYGGE